MFCPLIRAMRPRQWAKNVFIFAGVFFDGRIADVSAIAKSLGAFAVFCAVSSAVYLINDLADMQQDRLHPSKRYRPLASGELSPRVARFAAAGLLVLALPAAFLLQRGFGWVVVLYLVMMLWYNVSLKHLVIIDVMTIAAGFVLRVVAGAQVVVVSRFSPWLYVCTTLLALFIAISKRRSELILLEDSANHHRAILEEYSVSFLDNMNSLVTAAAVVSYSFYTFSAPNLPQNHSMMLTIPFVLYCLFRYMYLVHIKGLGGTPEDIVLGDRPLIIGILLWGLTAGLAIYWPVL